MTLIYPHFLTSLKILVKRSSAFLFITGKLRGRPVVANKSEETPDCDNYSDVCSDRTLVPVHSNDIEIFHDDQTPHSSTVIQRIK